MADITHLILEDASEASKQKFQAILDRIGWGIVVLLGPESPEIYASLKDRVDYMDAQLVAVWAKDKGAVQGAICELTGGDTVNFGPNGHRVVSINVNDAVCRALSAYEATLPLKIWGAVLCATGG